MIDAEGDDYDRQIQETQEEIKYLRKKLQQRKRKQSQKPRESTSVRLETVSASEDLLDQIYVKSIIGDLMTDLYQAELQRGWVKVIKLGEEILRLDRSHRTARAKTARAYFQRANYFHKKEKYERAIENLDRAIELSPNSTEKAEYYNLRGEINCKEKREYEQAAIDFNQAEKLDRTKANYFWRGLCYYHLQNYENAFTDFEHAVAILPASGVYYYFRGLTQEEMGKPMGALADYKEAIKLGYDQAKDNLMSVEQQISQRK